MNTRQIMQTFGWLLWRDIVVLKKNIWNRIIDAIIWSSTNIVITNFILPAFGIEPRFGLLVWVGTIITMSYFEAGWAAQELIADKVGNYHIGYLLTLPIPSWLIFIKTACGIALNCMLLSIVMVPLGKIILRNALDLSSLNPLKFTLIFILINFFCGFLSVWIFSWAKNTVRFSQVQRRVINPLWSFGGYQFTWFVLRKTFPRLALLTLLDPLTYAFEGLRSAILGPSQFIPFWISFCMLIVSNIVFAWWGMIWLKQQLDYV